jgi:hypothetical protein
LADRVSSAGCRKGSTSKVACSGGHQADAAPDSYLLVTVFGGPATAIDVAESNVREQETEICASITVFGSVVSGI